MQGMGRFQTRATTACGLANPGGTDSCGQGNGLSERLPLLGRFGQSPDGVDFGPAERPLGWMFRTRFFDFARLIFTTSELGVRHGAVKARPIRALPALVLRK